MNNNDLCFGIGEGWYDSSIEMYLDHECHAVRTAAQNRIQTIRQNMNIRFGS